MRFEFIRENCATWPIRLMCRVLEVSASGYYAWRKRPESPRKQANKKLLGDVQRLHRLHRGRYGSPRIHAALREEGIVASPGRVACLMLRHGLRALAGRKFKSCTTDSHLELGGLTLHSPSAGKLRFASQYTSFPRRRLQCAN